MLPMECEYLASDMGSEEWLSNSRSCVILTANPGISLKNAVGSSTGVPLAPMKTPVLPGFFHALI
jgi:hypothetical protein